MMIVNVMSALKNYCISFVYDSASVQLVTTITITIGYRNLQDKNKLPYVTLYKQLLKYKILFTKCIHLSLPISGLMDWFAPCCVRSQV